MKFFRKTSSLSNEAIILGNKHNLDKKWYMYVVQCRDGSFYCGSTIDIDRRIDEHNSKKKGAIYTRSRRPVILLYKETHPTRSDAQKAESRFKKLTRGKKLDYMVDQCTKRTHESYTKDIK